MFLHDKIPISKRAMGQFSAAWASPPPPPPVFHPHTAKTNNKYKRMPSPKFSLPRKVLVFSSLEIHNKLHKHLFKGDGSGVVKRLIGV